MRARLDQLEETRRRIAEATYELHATIGPARTSISAIAERAGVQRHTVYAHFPDLVSLFEACTSHGIRVTNPPLAADWEGIADPLERVRHALVEVYRHYRANTRLYGNIARDMPLMPEEARIGSRPYTDLREAWFTTLAAGWPAGAPNRPSIEAALRHALDFGTWLSLSSQGLSDDAVAEAMTSFVRLMSAAEVR
jgi:AcrR family transcriptional regulator